MLHEGAKIVQSELGGSVPGTVKELKGLPGIGPYTAGIDGSPAKIQFHSRIIFIISLFPHPCVSCETRTTCCLPAMTRLDKGGTPLAG